MSAYAPVRRSEANEDDVPRPSLAEEPGVKQSNRLVAIIRKYGRFIGPGLMVSVSYMDPGNFSTAVAAGSAHRYKMLFSVLVANLLAAFWQCLCAKLGAVTGLDLAQNCRRHLPPNLNLALYILAEVAIIATDLAEVVGTAISLNILFNVPLAFGVVLTVVDVLIVLMAYKPNGSLKLIRWFEMFVSLLVVATVVCFTIELFSVSISNVGDVFKGFLPSKAVVADDGIYLSLAILGATVMPHSLYLGSGVVQPRLRNYDISNGHYKPNETDVDNNHDNYRPSFDAINDTLNFTIAELLVSLFTVALFVNCSILIVAGATLYGTSENAVDADLFSIYDLLCKSLSKAAGTVFVLALLFSGQSAGIVCTLSGQMVSEGFLNWSVAPALRRSLTRAVAITPCLILVLVAGRRGLSGALNASQVVLSLLLPFVSAPLLYFTSNKEIMRVEVANNCYYDMRDVGIPLQDLCENAEDNTSDAVPETQPKYVDMSNSMFTTVCAVVLWVCISGLNFYLLASFSVGQETHL
ncbi:divalent metal ion transporter SMF2 [Lachancea thermotolerans CBS 6340]|uniref:KLTH0G06798p n=1 Tax=Lachancea thermotolerans (strain ATCC 56472 / CBS 6340 / NRRL Y-8284) TaxID=559295 RepID=C5DM85_LACTC|nr:KLTH0G06798p [Lachancea thermotolerans CBS 6340]CAR24896.1 KLTH0G06798p [Lachancea thermotolerans CBS 6340]